MSGSQWLLQPLLVSVKFIVIVCPDFRVGTLGGGVTFIGNRLLISMTLIGDDMVFVLQEGTSSFKMMSTISILACSRIMFKSSVRA